MEYGLFGECGLSSDWWAGSGLGLELRGFLVVLVGNVLPAGHRDAIRERASGSPPETLIALALLALIGGCEALDIAGSAPCCPTP
jgi:hypothetical protein